MVEGTIKRLLQEIKDRNFMRNNYDYIKFTSESSLKFATNSPFLFFFTCSFLADFKIKIKTSRKLLRVNKFKTC